jgi:hypothetical protein
MAGSSPGLRDESWDAARILFELVAKRFAQKPLLSADANPLPIRNNTTAASPAHQRENVHVERIRPNIPRQIGLRTIPYGP